MPGMPVGAVHVNVPLSNLAILYRPLEAGFIADEVIPRLPVANESNVYYKWAQGDFYGTDVSDLVPDKTESRAIEFGATTDSYQAARRELAWEISDRERQNADDQLRLETVKQEGVLGRLAMLRDMRAEALLRISSSTTTVAGETIAGGLDTSMTAAKTAFWDGAATTYQNIFGDVVKGIAKIRQSIGIKPNAIVVSALVSEGLNKSGFYTSAGGPQVVYSTEPAGLPQYGSYPLLPPVLWGMRVLSPGQIKNTAVEGQAASFSDVWGEDVRILYVAPGPAMDSPSVAYTFQAEPLETRQARDDRRRIDWFAVGSTIQEKIVAPFAGYVITDTMT
jgi:hypothetical protein